MYQERPNAAPLGLGSASSISTSTPEHLQPDSSLGEVSMDDEDSGEVGSNDESSASIGSSSVVLKRHDRTGATRSR